MSSTRLHQSSSSYTLDQLDPTTLAISLIPLLPPQLPQESSTHQSISPITLPVLAASLSTLPHSVVNAIHFLAQELKNLKEHQVLTGGRSHKNSNSKTTNADNESDGRDRENREKWLENQKVNHLKRSISSLTNLQSTLQSRLLTTVDTLSDLQQTHKRDTQQLADERDGVRAVNQVLKRKIATMEKQLLESKEIMESVLERVEVVNKGDWSIVEHGVIQVFSPLPQSTNFPTQVSTQDNSLLSEELCTFHQQCQGDKSPALRPESFDPMSKVSNLISSSSRSDKNQLNPSTTSDSNNRNNQRSLTLIVELTEELEHLRQEVKVELKSKHDEINRLKSLIKFRDDEIRQLMNRLEHFMGLDGFYVRNNPEDEPISTELPQESFNDLTADLEATPRQKLDQRGKGATNNINSSHSSFDRSDIREESPESQSSEERKLEEEIKQLETQLKEVTQTRHYPLPIDSKTSFAFDHPTGKSVAENDRSSLVSANASDDYAISRVLADLSNQVAELKFALKEVSRERDALKRLRSRSKKPPPSSSSQTDLDESSTSPETCRALKEALSRSEFECTRLNRLLAQSESRILELERQIAEQESEFERVAERVQEKLKDQRSKMLQAQTQIEQLQNEIEQVRNVERTTREELRKERKRVETLMNGLDQRKKKAPHDDDDGRIQNKRDVISHKQHSRSSVVSSSSSIASSSKPFVGSSKDPFN